MDSTLFFILAVVFVATLIRSALGFGEALLAVPLLALVIPIEIAVPLAVLVSVSIAAIVVAQDWRHVQLRSSVWLVLYTLLGIPLGVLMLTNVAEPLVKGVMAIVIIAFALYGLLHPRPVQLVDDRWAWCFGFVAGVLGGAYGMNGPPLVVFGALRGWSPERFRATLQAYFLPASAVGMLGYWLAGLWVPTVTRYYLLCLVPMLIATLLGRWLNRRLDPGTFLKLVHCGLIAIGILLMSQILWR